MTFNSIISKYFFVFIICILYVGNVLSYDTNDDSTKKFINVIHAELDSDKDGQVDKNEAKKLTDLNDNAKSYNSEKVFSQSLNRDILWRSWKQSESYTWTKEIVVLWLTYDIKLPEYEKTFLHHNINGTSVPRLALPDYCYLQQVLLIRSNAHCQRIATKAKNLILFGASREFQRQFPMKDLTAYSIISSLHSQLDDDKDGGVDPDEADEFVRDELKYTSDFDRAKKFNKDDNHISKEDLWRNWKSSEVYNWTEDDVVNWLCDHVDLCEHTVNFKSHHIDGSMIPSLAQSDVSNLFKDLKIRNPVHRKKIILKATDLILFGPPKKTQSRAKDSILLTLVLLTITGCCLAYSQNKYSKQQIQALQHQMKELGYAEDSLTTLQNKLDEAEKLTDKMTTEKIEIEEKLRTEIEKYKEDLCNTESQEYLKNDGTNDDQSTSQAGDFSMSEQLRLILQISYEVEGSFFFYKRNAAIKQMDCVKEMCEKLRKKKNTVIGAFRIAHSGLFDDMEKDLSDARTSIDQIKSDLLERSHRWQMIEKLTNFQLIPTPGLSKLRTDLATLIAEGAVKLTDIVGGSVDKLDPRRRPLVMPLPPGMRHTKTTTPQLPEYRTPRPVRVISAESLQSLAEIESLHEGLANSFVNVPRPYFHATIQDPDSYRICNAQSIQTVTESRSQTPVPMFNLNENETIKTLQKSDTQTSNSTQITKPPKEDKESTVVAKPENSTKKSIKRSKNSLAKLFS